MVLPSQALSFAARISEAEAMEAGNELMETYKGIKVRNKSQFPISPYFNPDS
jgi:hypothetical protein